MSISVEIYGTQWMRTLYSYHLPLSLVFRIWDVFLVEGTDFLLWVALVILDECKEQMMAIHDVGKLMNYFNNLSEKDYQTLLDHLSAQE